MPVYDSTSAFLKQQLKNFKEASKADKVLYVILVGLLLVKLIAYLNG